MKQRIKQIRIMYEGNLSLICHIFMSPSQIDSYVVIALVVISLIYIARVVPWLLVMLVGNARARMMMLIRIRK